VIPLLLSRLRIRTKLFLLLLTLVVVPFLAYTTILVAQVSAQMEAVGLHTAEQVLFQTASFVESRVDLVKRALDIMTLNPTLRDLAAADPAPYNQDPGLWIRDAAVFRQIADTAGQNNPDLRTVVFYTAGGLGASLSQDESPQFLPLAAQSGQLWFSRLAPRDNQPQWFDPAVPFDHAAEGDLHVLRRIPDDQNLQNTVGWVRADVRVRGFEEILNQGQFSASAAAFLVDDSGRLVARSARAQAWTAGEFSALAASVGGWSSVPAGGAVFRVGSEPIGTTAWRLIIAIPHQDIDAFGDQARGLLLLSFAAILPLIIPLSFWAANGATLRLAGLLTGVRRLGEGALDVQVPEQGADEISELTQGFNRMVGQIRHLVDERYQLGVEVKHLELEALQAQINPHFLYNTLDLISGIAQRAGEGSIVEAVSVLSRFYRLALSGGAEMLTLGKEFEHAATYLKIQNLRFGGAVDVRIELPEELAPLLVLKMIVQPLVENALLHGILEKPDERGLLVLRARRDADFLVIEVEDDGVGMDAAVLGQLLERLPGGGENGYGVYNIHRRLQLRYGEHASIVFESRVGEGTVVRLSLPLA
jgi:two-component system sensor histidine kinase YesM